MSRIPDELIERIKDASDIVEIVSEYVQLKKSGRNYTGLCPFHNEKTPSFSVNPDLQIYKCFGCGVGGSVFKFIQEIDRVSFVEAVAFLAQRSGMALPERQADPEQNEFADQIYRANELAQKYFHHLLLNDDQGRDALEYLRGRGLEGETIERFGLGYAPPGWDALLQVAGRRGLRPDIMEKAGLASEGQRGPYDRFRDRLTFPIANLSGRTIAFGARALREDQEPKYLNSPETPIYHKSRVLYGLNHTREAIRQQGRAVLVEGYMDLLSLAQQGIAPVVASAGTALTEEQGRMVSRYAQQVVLIFDGDAAGSAAALRGIEVLLATGLEARAVSLPDGHDPDTFVWERGPEALLEAVETAGSALDFYLEQLGRQADLSTVDGKARAVEACRPLLARCQDAVRRDLMLREVAQRLGIDEMAIRRELQQSLRRPAPRAGEAAAAPAHKDPPRREKEFLGLLLKFPQFIAPAAQQLGPDAFSDARARAIARMLFEQHGDATTLDLSLFMSSIEDEATVQLISACAMQGLDQEQVEQQWQDYLLRFKRDALTRQIDLSRQALQAAAKAGDAEEIARVNAALAELIKERQGLEQPGAS